MLYIDSRLINWNIFEVDLVSSLLFIETEVLNCVIVAGYSLAVKETPESDIIKVVNYDGFRQIVFAS